MEEETENEKDMDVLEVPTDGAAVKPESSTEAYLSADIFRDTDRGAWTNKREYLLTMIGYAVGLGNAWRFPYIAYQNGGGAFLIPYFMMLFLAGIPMFYIEAALGQFCGQSAFEAFNCVPLVKGVGLCMVLISFYIGIFYTVIIGYSVHYFFLSFSSVLPWTTCNHTNSDPACSEATFITGVATNETINATCVGDYCNQTISASENYWTNVVLQLSTGIDDIGGVNWYLLGELFGTWALICVCSIKGVKSVGKVVYFTALFPYVVLTILLIGSLRLDGATDGIYYFFKPEWGKLLEAKVWQEAATQIFFSLSVTLGGLITLSSYNSFHNNCYRDTWIVSSVNSFTSIYAAITIFSTLGFMAKKLGVDISEVVSGGPGLAFVVYPQAVTHLPVPQLWSALFFTMLFTLGLDTMFAITETVVATVADNWPHIFNRRKEALTIVTCIIFFLLGILIVTRGGFYWLTLVDTYVSGYTILFTVVVEIYAIVFMYGINNLILDIEMMLGKKPHIVWKIIWTYITPAILTVIFIASLIQWKRLTLGDYEFPRWAEALGGLCLVTCLGCIPASSVHAIRSHSGTLWERIKLSTKPNKYWRPFLDEDCTGRYAWAVAAGGPSGQGLLSKISEAEAESLPIEN